MTIESWLATRGGPHNRGDVAARLAALCDLNWVPVFIRRDTTPAQLEYLVEDLDAWSKALEYSEIGPSDYSNPTLFEIGVLRRVRFGSCSSVEFGTDPVPAFLLPAIRRLLECGSRIAVSGDSGSDAKHCALSPSLHLTTTSQEVFSYAQQVIERVAAVDQAAGKDFARTANYMGSKRALRAFLVEGIADVLPADALILDLMCGSGAASAAINSRWQTFVSDAQQFSCLLAHVQGGGFTEARASQLLDRLTGRARTHAERLATILSGFVEREDTILFRETSLDAVTAFRSLFEDFPTYPDAHDADATWDPKSMVAERQENIRLEPYCLFTAYFANTYFGIRQSLEIDSIRYAIDQLSDEADRRWALGALIATVSAIGTTHAAHFAQPMLRRELGVSKGKLARIQEKRSRSVLHEFSVRLLTLSKQSETIPREINILEGPWRDALRRFAAVQDARPRLVYLDAPYQREEYSRYYHVLETLVAYSYPTSVGIGRTPSKGSGPGHRFASEFSTHTRAKITASLVDVITTILSYGWQCAWSYADNAAADVTRVVDIVVSRTRCGVRSFSAPHIHRAQGRAQNSKHVTEYLILLSPAAEPRT